jgi:hypothetical protein
MMPPDCRQNPALEKTLGLHYSDFETRSRVFARLPETSTAKNRRFVRRVEKVGVTRTASGTPSEPRSNLSRASPPVDARHRHPFPRARARGSSPCLAPTILSARRQLSWPMWRGVNSSYFCVVVFFRPSEARPSIDSRQLWMPPYDCIPPAQTHDLASSGLAGEGPLFSRTRTGRGFAGDPSRCETL